MIPAFTDSPILSATGAAGGFAAGGPPAQCAATGGSDADAACRRKSHMFQKVRTQHAGCTPVAAGERPGRRAVLPPPHPPAPCAAAGGYDADAACRPKSHMFQKVRTQHAGCTPVAAGERSGRRAVLPPPHPPAPCASARGYRCRCCMSPEKPYVSGGSHATRRLHPGCTGGAARPPGRPGPHRTRGRHVQQPADTMQMLHVSQKA
jgi:hypothetical protein